VFSKFWFRPKVYIKQYVSKYWLQLGFITHKGKKKHMHSVVIFRTSELSVKF